MRRRGPIRRLGPVRRLGPGRRLAKDSPLIRSGGLPSGFRGFLPVHHHRGRSWRDTRLHLDLGDCVPGRRGAGGRAAGRCLCPLALARRGRGVPAEGRGQGQGQAEPLEPGLHQPRRSKSRAEIARIFCHCGPACNPAAVSLVLQVYIENMRSGLTRRSHVSYLLLPISLPCSRLLVPMPGVPTRGLDRFGRVSLAVHSADA